MRLMIHAPTDAALDRARAHAAALLASLPDAEVEIVVDNDGACAALDRPDPASDGMLVFCGLSLRAMDRAAGGAPVVAAAVRYIAERQAAGWAYMRA